MLARCENNFTELMNFFPASRPPLMPKPRMPPKPFLRYLAASLWLGSSGSPGYVTHLTSGCSLRYRATSSAFSECWRWRSGNVSSPCRKRNALNGLSAAPMSRSSCTRTLMMKATLPRPGKLPMGQAQRLQPLQEEERVERAERRADVAQQLHPHLDDESHVAQARKVAEHVPELQAVVAWVRLRELRELAVVPLELTRIHNDPADRRPVSADILGCRVD